MITETSRNAYEEFKTNLGECQMKVYNGYIKYGDRTNLELSTLINMPINVLTPRRKELLEKGIIELKGTRKSVIDNKEIGHMAEIYGIKKEKYLYVSHPKENINVGKENFPEQQNKKLLNEQIPVVENFPPREKYLSAPQI